MNIFSFITHSYWVE